MNEIIIQVKKLSKKYQKNLFSNVDFSLSTGELVFIHGPSGSGKSVFLKALVGLVPTDDGQVLYKGQELTPKEVPQFRSKVQYISQFSLGQEGEVLSFFEEAYSYSVHKEKVFSEERLIEILDKIGIPSSFLKQKMLQLSGGERQVVKIIRALLLEPEVLLLDEPTSSMDDSLKEKLEKLLVEFCNGGGAAIWITHQTSKFETLSSKSYQFPSFEINI